MDAFLKQTRLRFSGVHKEKTEEDRRIPLQKSQSFKEKKKSQNWLQRQFSRQMSREYHSDNGIERAAAVAAAAFAIKRLEETQIPDPKKTTQRPETFSTAIKSIKEDKPSFAAETGRTSKQFSGETSFRISGSQENEFPISATTTTAKMPIQPVPSIKRTPTFVERLNSNIGLNPETLPPKSEPPVTFESTIPPKEIQRQSSTKPGTPTTVTRQQSSIGSVIEETKADAWEKAELAKIKDRYEKQKSTITSWEEKKAAKARRKLDRTESELEGRRLHALEEFRTDMEFINQIARGAREKAEEKRNKKEIKAREKAKKIRTTGKEPKTCCCC